MHRDRQWVYVTHQHRWKRSQHRRWQDKRGGVSWKRYREAWRSCEDCQYHWRKWWHVDCRQHAEMYKVLRTYERPTLETFGRGTPPKWWRRAENRKYKRQMGQLLYHGRDEDMTKMARTAGWYW